MRVIGSRIWRCERVHFIRWFACVQYSNRIKFQAILCKSLYSLKVATGSSAFPKMDLSDFKSRL